MSAVIELSKHRKPAKEKPKPGPIAKIVMMYINNGYSLFGDATSYDTAKAMAKAAGLKRIKCIEIAMRAERAEYGIRNVWED